MSDSQLCDHEISYNLLSLLCPTIVNGYGLNQKLNVLFQKQVDWKHLHFPNTICLKA